MPQAVSTEQARAAARARLEQATGGQPASPPGEDPAPSELARILGISVPVSVTLAQRPMTIEAIMAIAVGTILEFDVPADSDLTLYVGNQPIATGKAVKVGENFGIRLSQVGTVRDRIGAMAPPS
jgi:flagellar motor switch protein FliN/FliY